MAFSFGITMHFRMMACGADFSFVRHKVGHARKPLGRFVCDNILVYETNLM